MTAIVIADDDPLYLELIQFRLNRIGFASRVAGSATDLFCRLGTESPKLLILDDQLSGASTSAILQYIRSQSGDFPVILLTTAWRESEILDHLNSGVSEYLVKPFSAGELLARVGRHLDRRQVLPEQLLQG